MGKTARQASNRRRQSQGNPAQRGVGSQRAANSTKSLQSQPGATRPGATSAERRAAARKSAKGASAGHLGADINARQTQRWRAPSWHSPRVAIAVALWVLGLALLVLMSVFAHHDPTFTGDVGVEEAVQRITQPVIDRIINFASDANWPTPAGAIAIVIILALAVLRQFRAAFVSAFSGFGADFVNVQLNGIVARPRPSNVHITTVAHLGLHSFPSGHVTHVTAFYGFLFFLCMDYSRRYPAWRRPLFVGKLICAYFLIFIGISRVLEGEHWPSDVLASYLLGALFLTVAIAIYHLLARVNLPAWWASRRARTSLTR